MRACGDSLFSLACSSLWLRVVRTGSSRSTAARLPQGSGQSITYATLPNGQIPANEVAIVFLAHTSTAPVKCPNGITPLMTTDPATHGTGIGKAFHITTSAPVAGYQIYPYG